MENRFELMEEELEYWIHDRQTNKNYGLYTFDFSDLEKILNEQDKKIKELEADVDFWKLKAEIIFKACEDKSVRDTKVLCGLVEENQQLKQSQNSKAIEVLEKIKKYFCEESVEGDDIKTGDWIYTKDIVEVAEYIDNQITELRGGENDN